MASPTPLVTVVVPVDDSGGHLAACIQSILEQPIEGLEVVAVGDASSDGSADILSRLAANDDRLRVRTMGARERPGPVCNAGLAEARGTYVAFLDSADFYLPGALAELVGVARDDRVDFAAGSAQSHLEASTGEVYSARDDAGKSLVEVQSASIDDHAEIIHVQSPGQCVFDRDFLVRNDLQFRQGDHAGRGFITACIFAAGRISVRPDLILYNHRLPASDGPLEQAGDQLWSKLEVSRACLGAFRRSPRPSDPAKRETIERFLVLRDLTRFARDVLPVVARTFAGDDRAKYYGQCADLYRPATDVVRGRPRHQRIRRRYTVDADVALVFELLMESRFADLDALMADDPIGEETTRGLLDAGASAFVADLFRDLTEGRSRLVRRSFAATPPIVPGRIDRVVVHIGMRKTGSTYLQNVLEQNRSRLAERGILFPLFGLRRRSRSRPLRTAGHDVLVDAIESGDFGRTAGFRDEMAEADGCNRAILSCERLSLLGSETDLTTLKAMLGDTEKRIVLVLRRQDSWAESAYREMVTNGYGRTTAEIDAYVHGLEERGVLDYRRLVELWAGVFGTENVTVLTLDSAGADLVDLARTIIGLTGVEDIGDLARPVPDAANRFDLGRDDLEVIRLFNGLPFYNRRHYFEFVDAYHGWRAGKAEPAESFRLMAPGTRGALLDRYRQGNAWIAREFLGRDGDLFAMGIVDDDVEAPDIPLEKLRFAYSFYVNTGDRHATAGTRNLVHGGWLEGIVRRARSGRRKGGL